MSDPSRPSLHVRRLGRRDYAETLALQHHLVDARIAGEVGDMLLLVEHPPVITLGRRRSAGDNVVLAGDTPVVQVERGGDVTWHGPGQLVGYPIIALTEAERDVHLVLRHLEDALIAVLAALDLPGERRQGYTGVWCRSKKLVSLGVAVRRWVTFHGFALNVDPDLSQFQRINPCGMQAAVMGSVARQGGRIPAWEALETLAATEIARSFGRVIFR